LMEAWLGDRGVSQPGHPSSKHISPASQPQRLLIRLGFPAPDLELLLNPWCEIPGLTTPGIIDPGAFDQRRDRQRRHLLGPLWRIACPRQPA